MSGRKGHEAAELTPFSYQILVSLATGDLHGYGVLKDIEARAGEGSVPSTGALYLALQRLEDMGVTDLMAALVDLGDDTYNRTLDFLTAQL